MGMNPASKGGPGTNNEESGGATSTSGGRNVTSTGYPKSNPGYGGGPGDTHAGETFDSGQGVIDALAQPMDDDGDLLTSTYYEKSSPVSPRPGGGPGDIPDPKVVNRGYTNQKTPIPTAKRVGTQRQSWGDNPSKSGK